jgi:formamidopyrimidine-DNA glycosylase
MKTNIARPSTESSIRYYSLFLLMPELPEVETVVRGLRPDLLERTIESAWTDWPRGLVTPDESGFLARIRGQQVKDVQRRAKYIVIKLDSDWLMIHLKMTGRLYVVPDASQHESDRWMHFFFQLDNAHQLRFSDSRKFGRVVLTEDTEPFLGKLGPEPLSDDFTPEAFKRLLSRRSGRIKPLLMNQAFVAGIGNIYADEALHRAHIAPLRSSDSLKKAEVIALHQAIRHVLNQGIERQGASIGWYRRADGGEGSMQDDFLAYGRTGEPCLTCGRGTIERIVVGQRGTHYCPQCQR